MLLSLSLHKDTTARYLKTAETCTAIAFWLSLPALPILYKYVTAIPSSEMIAQADSVFLRYSYFLQYIRCEVEMDLIMLDLFLEEEAQLKDLHKALSSRYFWDQSVRQARDNIGQLLCALEKCKFFRPNIKKLYEIKNLIDRLEADQQIDEQLLKNAQVLGARSSAYPLVYVVEQIRADLDWLNNCLSKALFIFSDRIYLLELNLLLHKTEEILVASDQYRQQLHDQNMFKLEERKILVEERRLAVEECSAQAQIERSLAEQKKGSSVKATSRN